jgi:hypothetical chaperone protein
MNFIGIDFGTSNSLASLFENNKFEFVKFPDGNIGNPTILYFPAKEKQYCIGNAGIERYLTHLENNEGVGRLMLSIKSLLPDTSFDYTVVTGYGRQTGEELVAKFLSKLKELAEAQFSRVFDGVVLGRPVNFTELAVGRLQDAAKSAGFKEIIFWLEPVAAALAYETTLTADELVCVVDIGGGTSDVCVIETSKTRSFLPNRLNDIKSVSGVYQAGDEFSSQIMQQKLAPKFGAGSTFTSLGKVLPFPIHIINRLAKWHRINLLRNIDDLSTISSIYRTTNHPEDLERLQTLIKNYYGFELFGAIDSAKQRLSESNTTEIKFRRLDLFEEISIVEFENIIGKTVKKIEQSIFDCLSSASIKPERINRVLLTGGSSQVPLLNQTVVNIFGEEKILRPGFFSSVATGLGHVASLFK